MPSTLLNQGIPVVGPMLNWLIGSRNERFVKKYTMRVEAINRLEPEIRELTDPQLRAKVEGFRARIDKGETADDLLVEAFAAAREAMDRAVGIRNIFNPRHEARFDPAALPAPVRALYDQVKADIAGREPTPPTGEFLGCAEPVHPYLQVDIPVELYNAVREMYPLSKPPFRARPFDVQLIGGMVLYQGKIAEMKTGEGKTIVGPLACYLAAIEGRKVHVVTVNDYLVQRDRDWTFPYFHALGMTVGAIHPQHMQPEPVKRDMYKCDVVYGTTSEFGFDYLRDNMKRRVEDQVQKARQFAIVDEVDSILIDEARTPLIISGAAHEDAPRYEIADRLARQLVEKQKPWQEADRKVQQATRRVKGLEGDIRNARDKAKVPALEADLKQARTELPPLERERSQHTQYFEVEMDRKQVHLTHDGIAEAQRIAGVGSFYVGENMDLPHLLSQAVRAHVVYENERDYIIMPVDDPMTGQKGPGIVIVDVNTGRPMIGRQWSDGLHQAVEAKERVAIKQETQTVATITIQNFFKMYKRLAGMTGTADTEAQEFHDIYRLDVVSIPTNLPVIRRDQDDLMFLAGKDKWSSIVDEIKNFHDAGRPILVGTTSVEKSETLSKALTSKYAIKHEVLNAKPEKIAREAEVVENAGQLGSVMIATNMAGRGTDIKLGAVTRESLLDHWLRRGIASRELTIEATDDQVRENIYRKIAARELEVPKHEAEAMAFPDLEMRLLRHWALKYTWMSPKRIESTDAETLRQEIDAQGRFLLHRVRWFSSVEDLGGLHVIGTERHESRRIDNQLRGRSGRQGDKGSSRFFVSLDDDLMKLFAGERTMKILSTLGMKEGDAIEHPMLSKSVERAQRKVEERNFQVRKTILDYDEVMEHQRQGFYGLRQRVLEGRDVRGLIFGYIRDASRDAAREYLAKDYAAQCASEFVRQTLDVNIVPERLRALEINEMEARIRRDAKDEARQMIDVTLGEYIPSESSEFEMDFDAEGLCRWAKVHFGLDLDPEKVQRDGTQGRAAVRETLNQAAETKIDTADLSGLIKFTERDYGARELASWAESKFGFKLDPARILEAAQEDPTRVETLILEQAEELYRAHEIGYPVDFVMNTTMQLMRQAPPVAMDYMLRFANERFGLGWTAESLMKIPPQQAREVLRGASERFVKDGVIQKRIDEALAITDHAALETWFREILKTEPPEGVKRMDAQERELAIRAKVENALRPELLYFERTMMIETLDELWKNHLYDMDQLRDAIGYRAFSQQDPRIEYKREGSRTFKEMMQSVRDRITDQVFKLQLMPQFTVQAPPRPAAPLTPAAPPTLTPSAPTRDPYLSAAPQPRPSQTAGVLGGAGAAASMISGPGIDPGSRPPAVGSGGMGGSGSAGAVGVPAAAPPSERAQRDLESAQRAGTGGANGDAAARSQPVVKRDKTYGRNDPCPMNSGRKYKKCCNRNDGTCDGSGMNQ